MNDAENEMEDNEELDAVEEGESFLSSIMLPLAIFFGLAIAVLLVGLVIR